MKTSKFILPVLLSSAVLLSSCSTTPVTGRKQMNLTSDTKVAEMTIAAFEDMKRQMPISTHAAYNEMLQSVGNRISQQVFWDMPLAEWEFVVFDQNEVNAFAMPGGKVGIFTGLFQIVKTEDELASVVAHEIAHVTARHTHERISQQMVIGAGGQLVGIAAAVTGAGVAGLGGGSYINMTPMIMGLYGIGTGQAAQAWDQKKEAEADHIGIMYMAKAGYDPNAAITVMERMVELEGGMGGNNYNSTHPSSMDRLNALHSYLEDALAEYEKSKEFFY
ncbi:M48 family metallopeptidase [Pelagicoccus enzymogenes]|nr:M48 family metallopeptidase [Pelagicoccus enzymogenes]